MNCLIENEYIRELSLQKIKSPMYSQMNCLIENEYIRERSLQKKITYVFPNELPNWKRIHKGTFPPKKKNYVFPNELPNWKRILKGKNGKKREKNVGVLYCGGGFIIVNRELAYFIAGGFINAMWTLHDILWYMMIYIYIYTYNDWYISTSGATMKRERERVRAVLYSQIYCFCAPWLSPLLEWYGDKCTRTRYVIDYVYNYQWWLIHDINDSYHYAYHNGRMIHMMG